MMVADLEILKQVTVKEFNNFVDREVSKSRSQINCSVALQELACIFGSVSFPGLGTGLTVACYYSKQCKSVCMGMSLCDYWMLC